MSGTHRFALPRSFVLLGLVFLAAAAGCTAVAIIEKQPSLLLSAGFFVAIILYGVLARPRISGSTLHVGLKSRDLSAGGRAAFRAYTYRYNGIKAQRKVQLVFIDPKGSKMALNISSPGKLVHRPVDYAALSAVMRANPNMAEMATELDSVVNGSSGRRADMYKRLAGRR